MLEKGYAKDLEEECEQGVSALHMAAFMGHMAMTLALLAAGAKINFQGRARLSALHWAVGGSRVEIVRELLERGADVHLGGPLGKTPVHIAAAFGDADTVSLLCLKGADVDRPSDVGWSPLHSAAYYNNVAATRALLSAGADATLRVDGDGASALDLAAEEGHVDIARALIENGVDANAAKETGMTALHVAAANDRAEVVTLLCLKGAAVDALSHPECTPLFLATTRRKVAATRALLTAGADVTLRDNASGLSALDMAVWFGFAGITSALIEHGVDITAAGVDGCTALHFAAARGHAEVVTLLCLHGAAIDALSDHGCTPLHLAAMRGEVAATRALLTAGADVTLRNMEDGKSALDLAAFEGHADAASAIIERGGDVNAAGTDGQTPLHRAAVGSTAVGSAEVVSLFCLEYGAAVNASDGGGFTPILSAALRGNVAATQALLAAGADVTLRENMLDFSPLDVAATMGHADVVRLIVDHGIDVNAASRDGITALHAAASRNRLEVIDVLVAAGADVNAEQVGQGEGDTCLHMAASHAHTPSVLALLKYGARADKKNGRGQSPLHAAAAAVNAGIFGTVEVVDLLLRHGTDEKAIDIDGQTAADVIRTPVEGHDRRAEDVERVLALLANSPADRAWRRRGFLVLCRARYPCGGVLLRQFGNYTIAKRTRSRAKASRAEVEWAGVASMLMGAGADTISLMGDGADLIFESIVAFL
eukprot:g14662.t1